MSHCSRCPLSQCTCGRLPDPYIHLSALIEVLLTLVLLLGSQTAYGQSGSENCPLAPEEDKFLEQLLISATPQGCLRELIGADLAACFHRQTWHWQGNKTRECSGLSRYAYASVKGVGPADSKACPAPGRDLGYMESFVTVAITSTGRVGEEGQNIGQLADLDAVEDCNSNSGDISDQVCQLTLKGACNLVYKVTGEPATGISTSGSTSRSSGMQIGGAGSRPVVDTAGNETFNEGANARDVEMDAAESKAGDRAMLSLLSVLIVLVLYCVG